MFSGGTRQSNDVEHSGPDLSLFPVSGKLVQVRDTSESAIYVHSNGPRHIKAKIDDRLNVFSGGTRQSNDVEHNGLDLGLFPVSSKLVQVRDTSESAIYVHSNGPRHIPLKAGYGHWDRICPSGIYLSFDKTLAMRSYDLGSTPQDSHASEGL